MRYSLFRDLINLVMTYDYDKPRKTEIIARMILYAALILSMIGACVLGFHNHIVLMILIVFLVPPVIIILYLFVIRKVEKMIKEEEKYHTDSPAVFDAPDTDTEPEPEKLTIVCHDCGTKQPSERKTCLSCGADLPDDTE